MRNGVKCKRVNECNKFATCPNVCTVHHYGAGGAGGVVEEAGRQVAEVAARNKCKEFQC